MAAIKRFFEKRKLDVKFKKAGGGHKLAEPSQPVPSTSRQGSMGHSPRAHPTNEAQMAAYAALSRLDQPKGGPSLGTSAASVKVQVRKELENERQQAAKLKAEAELYSPPTEVEIECSPHLAVNGVFFKCPLVGTLVLPKKEMEEHIENFLESQLVEEPEMTTALMIHTLSKDKEKIDICVETLCKYIDNIVSHPGELKYTRIRVNNKAFQERVAPIKGSEEFLQAAGFSIKSVEGIEKIEEDFLVMDPDLAQDRDRLVSLKDVLLAAEAVKPELDRDLRIVYPSPYSSRMEVPEEFYSISPEELKREQQRRNEAVERMGMLRTKEMREREQTRELRRYRYTIIRTRFPDGNYLQGTFRAREKFKAVYDFIRENLTNDWMPFFLSTQTGQRLNEDELSLAELGLAPAAIVNFQFDANLMKEIAAQQGSVEENNYIRAEVMLSAKHM